VIKTKRADIIEETYKADAFNQIGVFLLSRPSHKLCKPPERCKIESTDQEVLLWQEEIEIRNGKQSGKR
jgi:hypothetical protein